MSKRTQSNLLIDKQSTNVDSINYKSTPDRYHTLSSTDREMGQGPISQGLSASLVTQQSWGAKSPHVARGGKSPSPQSLPTPKSLPTTTVRRGAQTKPVTAYSNSGNPSNIESMTQKQRMEDPSIRNKQPVRENQIQKQLIVGKEELISSLVQDSTNIGKTPERKLPQKSVVLPTQQSTKRSNSSKQVKSRQDSVHLYFGEWNNFKYIDVMDDIKYTPNLLNYSIPYDTANNIVKFLIQEINDMEIDTITVIEVGANIGTFTLALLSDIDIDDVVAYEIDPNRKDMIRNNIDAYDMLEKLMLGSEFDFVPDQYKDVILFYNLPFLLNDSQYSNIFKDTSDIETSIENNKDKVSIAIVLTTNNYDFNEIPGFTCEYVELDNKKNYKDDVLLYICKNNDFFETELDSYNDLQVPISVDTKSKSKLPISQSGFLQDSTPREGKSSTSSDANRTSLQSQKNTKNRLLAAEVPSLQSVNVEKRLNLNDIPLDKNKVVSESRKKIPILPNTENKSTPKYGISNINMKTSSNVKLKMPQPSRSGDTQKTQKVDLIRQTPYTENEEIAKKEELRSFIKKLLKNKKVYGEQIVIDRFITSITEPNKDGEDPMDIWIKAFTHSTYNPVENYESLETLGDSILKAAFVDWLVENFPKYSPKDISNMNSYYMSKPFQHKLARKEGFEQYILIIGINPSIHDLEDVFESFVGALYKVGNQFVGKGMGFIFATRYIGSIFDEIRKDGNLDERVLKGPPKTQIKEFIKDKLALKDENNPDNIAQPKEIDYPNPNNTGRIVEIRFPDNVIHEINKRAFGNRSVHKLHIGKPIGIGYGSSKKVASFEAYRDALNNLDKLGLNSDWFQDLYDKRWKEELNKTNPSIIVSLNHKLSKDGFKTSYFSKPRQKYNPIDGVTTKYMQYYGVREDGSYVLIAEVYNNDNSKAREEAIKKYINN